MKKVFHFMVLLIIPVGLILMAYDAGSPGGKTGSPGDGGINCTECHTGTAIPTTTGISTNIPPEGYEPGQTYNITVIGNHPGVVKFGFELTVEDSQGNKVGELSVTDPLQTQYTNNDSAITHTSDGTTPAGNMKTWNMDWTAPPAAVGDIGFYTAINAANGNDLTSGDTIYICELFVPPTAPSSIVSIDPDSAYQTEVVVTTIIGYNTQFISGTPSVSIRYHDNPGEVITGTNINVQSNTLLEATFDIPGDASIGLWDLHVDDMVLENAFTVLDDVPMLTSVDPKIVYQTDTVILRITGMFTNFTGSSVVVLKYHPNPSEIMEPIDVNVISPTYLQAEFIIPVDASVGLWDVHVDDLVLEEGLTVSIPTWVTSLKDPDKLMLYPNPSSGLIHLEQAGDANVHIFNCVGSLIATYEKVNDKIVLDLTGSPEGIYFVRIETVSKEIVRKIVINR